MSLHGNRRTLRERVANLIVIDESQASIKMLLRCLRKKRTSATEAGNLSVMRSYRFQNNRTFLLRMKTRDVRREDKFTVTTLKFCDA